MCLRGCCLPSLWIEYPYRVALVGSHLEVVASVALSVSLFRVLAVSCVLLSRAGALVPEDLQSGIDPVGSAAGQNQGHRNCYEDQVELVSPRPR